MSAYIVAPETIDRIVTYIDRLQFHNEWLYLETLRAAEVSPGRPDTPTALGQAMYRLNVASVDHRYNESNHIPVYQHTHRHAEPVQVYKSLECFLYQCNEGDVDEQPLYKALKRLQQYIARRIITNLPEYQAAAWG